MDLWCEGFSYLVRSYDETLRQAYGNKWSRDVSKGYAALLYGLHACNLDNVSMDYFTLFYVLGNPGSPLNSFFIASDNFDVFLTNLTSKSWISSLVQRGVVQDFDDALTFVTSINKWCRYREFQFYMRPNLLGYSQCVLRLYIV